MLNTLKWMLYPRPEILWQEPSTVRRCKRIDPLDGVDIEKEYALIQRKKSQLSASKRRMVILRYEELYSN